MNIFVTGSNGYIGSEFIKKANPLNKIIYLPKLINEVLKYLRGVNKKIEGVLQTSYTETQENSAIRVAIVGFPNVGKSSIFNHILGQSRSIVTDERGTTRDVVEKELYIGTTLVTLIDTAGLRHTKNKAEVIGINKTYEEILKRPNISIDTINNHLNQHIKIKKSIKSSSLV